jgi:hexosaminidase
MKTLLLLPFIFFSGIAMSMDVPALPHVVPAPQQIVSTRTPFKITSGTKIIVSGGSDRLAFIARQLNEELAAANAPVLKVALETSLRKVPSDYIYLGTASSGFAKTFLAERKGTLTAAMQDEGYFLDVRPEGVVIVAESEKGVFYGAMTLLQLLRHEKRSHIVDGVSIHDFPALRVRGITDDISRGQVSTLENFKKIIRFCGQYKLNVYSPYMEDVFQFSRHPLIGKDRGAVSPADWKELDAYAKSYFVELIPTFETLGHWENILIQPEYIRYAEFPGAHTVNISDEKLYALLDEMIGEIAGCFSSEYFNMAADESWDVGLGVNRERVAKSDIATVHADHYLRVVDILAKYHKKPMMYGDVILNHPSILEKIPNGITIIDWHYGGAWHYGSPEVFKRAGFPFIVSPAVWNFSSPFPAYLNSFVNIRNLNRDGMENGSIGLLTSTWGDYGGEALREFNYYGYAWTSACAWNPAAATVDEFNKGFFPSFFGTQGKEMETVFNYLSTPANSYHFHELWRHPMLPMRVSTSWDSMLPAILRVQSIEATMPDVLDLLNTAKLSVTRNADQLQDFEFAAHLNLWFAKKISAQEQIKLLRASAAAGGDTTAIARRIIALTGGVIDCLKGLKDEFARVWLATNRSPGLDLLQKRYDRQISYWQELMDQTRHGVFADTVVLESAFIYHPSANPSMNNVPQVKSACFRKLFAVPPGLRSAKLQLIGDTYAIVAVNDKRVGEVYARRSLSLTEEHQRVKVFDILPLLRDAANCITVEVQNFSPAGSAGVNIYCEFETKDGAVQKLPTDSSWKVSEKPVQGWKNASFNDSSWVNAAAKPFGWTIVRPNFAAGRGSWIER